MKAFKLSMVLVVGLMVLVGCKEDQPASAMTVDWYKTNEQARKEMLVKCNNNPGELAATADCVNARKANSDIQWGEDSNKAINVKPLTAKDMQ